MMGKWGFYCTLTVLKVKQPTNADVFPVDARAERSDNQKYVYICRLTDLTIKKRACVTLTFPLRLGNF